MNQEPMSAEQIVASLASQPVGAGVSAEEKSAVLAEPQGVLLGAWQPGTNVPGNDGEYEVVDPITGMVSRATWDSLFEAWSCEAQYPTWRGVL
jgi:hypothetical protein